MRALQADCIVVSTTRWTPGQFQLIGTLWPAADVMVIVTAVRVR